MTQNELKVAGRIGAELGAAKAENDRLRGLLREAAKFIETGDMRGLNMIEVHAALSQQAEPTDTYTAVDMATAAAQAFRDGQAAVEQAPAQDEQDLVSETLEWYASMGKSGARARTALAAYQATRPAQTEQQPVARVAGNEIERYLRWEDGVAAFDLEIGAKLYADPIAHTATQGKFRMGDLVKKSTGSEWEGRVVGWYSTEQTKEGYAVESSAHRNSVQIYPAKALELVPMAAKEA